MTDTPTRLERVLRQFRQDALAALRDGVSGFDLQDALDQAGAEHDEHERHAAGEKP